MNINDFTEELESGINKHNKLLFTIDKHTQDFDIGKINKIYKNIKEIVEIDTKLIQFLDKNTNNGYGDNLKNKLTIGLQKSLKKFNILKTLSDINTIKASINIEEIKINELDEKIKILKQKIEFIKNEASSFYKTPNSNLEKQIQNYEAYLQEISLKNTQDDLTDLLGENNYNFDQLVDTSIHVNKKNKAMILQNKLDELNRIDEKYKENTLTEDEISEYAVSLDEKIQNIREFAQQKNLLNNSLLNNLKYFEGLSDQIKVLKITGKLNINKQLG